MFTLPRMVKFEWRCFSGHEVTSGEGENYCIDLHDDPDFREVGEPPHRVRMVGPLCRECFIAHREAAHAHSA